MGQTAETTQRMTLRRPDEEVLTLEVKLERLHLQDGDFLLVKIWPDATAAQIDAMMRSVREIIDRMSVNIIAYVVRPEAMNIAALSEEEMAKAGWFRVAKSMRANKALQALFQRYDALRATPSDEEADMQPFLEAMQDARAAFGETL